MTWNDLIGAALTESHLLGRGLPINAELTQEAYRRLDLLLDELDGMGIEIPGIYSELQFNTVPGQNLYWLGTGSNPSTFPIRPVKIIGGTFQINPGVTETMVPLDLRAYWKIPIKNTLSPPWNFALNPDYPQSKLFFYPTPDKIYPVILFCKIKWEDTFGNPQCNSCLQAEIAEGYAMGLVYCLAHALAVKNGIDTPQMASNAAHGRAIMTVQTPRQNPDDMFGLPQGLFPPSVIAAGMNP